VENFITSLKEKAEHEVKTKFPAKIVELTNLLASPDFNIKDPAQLNQKVNIPVPDAQAILRGCNNHCNSLEETEIEVPATRGGKRRKLDKVTPPTPTPTDDGEHDNGKAHAQGTKVLALPSGPVFCNTNITRLIDMVKPHIRELVEDSNLVS